ncbi:MAG: acetyl-CoA carboxylase biotin carboxyl carrier protein [Bacteroidota bacterium]
MEFKEIQDLIKLVNKSSLSEVEIEKKDFKLTIKREQADNQVVYAAAPPVAAIPASVPQVQAAPAAVPTPPPAKEAPVPAQEEDTSNLYEFKSPMIGTFYRSSSPEIPPFAKVGDEIQQGDVLCIVEAMKLFNELEAEVSGKIVKIMVENAQPVEYDQVLFLIDTNV